MRELTKQFLKDCHLGVKAVRTGYAALVSWLPTWLLEVVYFDDEPTDQNFDEDDWYIFWTAMRMDLQTIHLLASRCFSLHEGCLSPRGLRPSWTVGLDRAHCVTIGARTLYGLLSWKMHSVGSVAARFSERWGQWVFFLRRSKNWRSRSIPPSFVVVR